LYVADLEQALSLAEVLDGRDLRTRIMAELTVGRGWRGDFEGAEILLRTLEADAFVRSQPFAASYVRTLRAMANGMTRRADQACRALLAEAEWAAAAAVPDYAMSNLFIAASIVRLNGDEDRAVELLIAASEFDLDRFTRQTHARVAYELARIAVSRDVPEEGDRLRVAGRFFETYGDHRSALVFRRDLGRWLWRHGESDEARSCLQSVAAPLLMIESRAAAPAFAALAELAGLSGPAGRQSARTLGTAAMFYAANGFGLPLNPGEQADLDATAHLREHGETDPTAIINALISMNLAYPSTS
jgi:hypothetical protein